MIAWKPFYECSINPQRLQLALDNEKDESDPTVHHAFAIKSGVWSETIIYNYHAKTIRRCIRCINLIKRVFQSKYLECKG